MDPAGRLINWSVAAVLAMSAGLACAQGRGATAAQARSYILTAFMTQAAPAILSERVQLGRELEKRLALPAGADSRKVYEALVTLTNDKTLDVRRATPEELKNYGARPGLRTELPVYLLEAGDTKLVVQYDLEANNVPFVGQFGVPLPVEPAPVVASVPAPAPVVAAPPPAPVPAPAPLAAVRHEPEPKKPAVVTLVWATEEFPYKKSSLTPAIRARLDSDVVPKLKDFAEVRYLNISGHTDNIGSAAYNQRLSERRARNVRAYLVARGADPKKIEVYGYGQTMPKKRCVGHEADALRQCLGPNRRVQIEVEGTLKH